MPEVRMTPDASLISGNGETHSPLVYTVHLSDNKPLVKIVRPLLSYKANLNQN